MNRPAGGFDLRRLVDQVITLSETDAAPANPHPLGLGLSARHRFILPGAADVRLPKVEDGLVRLRRATSERVVTVPADYSAAAWGALLRPAAMLGEVSLPEEWLLNQDMTLDASQRACLRSVALAAVVQLPGDLVDGDGRLNHPVAGVGVLSVLTKPAATHISTDAWLAATWVTSTASLAAELGAVRQLAPAVSAKQRERMPRRAVVLLGRHLTSSNVPTAPSVEPADLPEPSDEPKRHAGNDLATHLRVEGELFGYRVTVMILEPASRGRILQALRREPPRLVVAALAAADGWAEIQQEYRAAQPDGTFTRVDADHPADLRLSVREALSVDAGVTAALMLATPERAGAADAPVANDDGTRADGVQVERWPCQVTQRRVHDTFGTMVSDEAGAIWYTRDHAGHAGTFFKMYRLVNRTFTHVADLDRERNVIDKHKGQVGALIPYDDTRGVGV